MQRAHMQPTRRQQICLQRSDSNFIPIQVNNGTNDAILLQQAQSQAQVHQNNLDSSWEGVSGGYCNDRNGSGNSQNSGYFVFL